MLCCSATTLLSAPLPADFLRDLLFLPAPQGAGDSNTESIKSWDLKINSSVHMPALSLTGCVASSKSLARPESEFLYSCPCNEFPQSRWLRTTPICYLTICSSLVAQWLRLHLLLQKVGSVPGWGTKILPATGHGQKTNKK